MRYVFYGFLNESDGHFFDGFKADADPRLVYGGTIVVDAESDMGALDKAWAVGNRMARDAAGNAWPPFSRSLSVGDVLVAEANDSLPRPGAWAVDVAGFKGLPGDLKLNLGAYHYGVDRLGPVGTPKVESEVNS
jgi:hypothetical protein